MRGIFRLVILAGTLSACQTGAEHQAEQDAITAQRLARFEGQTMAAFIAGAPGFQPVDYMPVQGGRVFLFEAVGGALTFPGSYGAPTVHRTFSCRLQIHSRQTGPSGYADSWIIDRIEHSGACNSA